MRYWTVIVLAGLGTYGLRVSLILLLGRVTVPPVVARGFTYVGPAVMAAIAVPPILAPAGAFDPATLRLPAAAAAALVAWRFRSVPLTLAVGLGTFTLLTRLL